MTGPFENRISAAQDAQDGVPSPGHADQAAALAALLDAHQRAIAEAFAIPPHLLGDGQAALDRFAREIGSLGGAGGLLGAMTPSPFGTATTPFGLGRLGGDFLPRQDIGNHWHGMLGAMPDLRPVLSQDQIDEVSAATRRAAQLPRALVVLYVVLAGAIAAMIAWAAFSR